MLKKGYFWNGTGTMELLGQAWNWNDLFFGTNVLGTRSVADRAQAQVWYRIDAFCIW